jgi:hypothetical protein
VEIQGLSLPVSPDGEIPDLPEDLTEITDSQLMRLLSAYTTWGEYAAAVVTRYAVDEESLAAQLEREKAVAALRHQNHKSVAAQKAAALCDPAVQELDEDYQGARARRKFAEVVMNGAERKAAVISRELTRRVGRHDREARTGRWNP